MARKYSVLFLILAGQLGVQAALYFESWFWASLALFYVSMSFGLLGIAYAGLGGKVFLKSQSGKLNPVICLIFGPYFLINEVIFWIYKRAYSEPAVALVSPNLYLGRRLTESEAAQGVASGWQSVLDVAAEFSEVEALRKLPGYRSLPLLDGTAPTADQIREAVSWIEQATSLGPVYVHCALGHGRSACIVVAYLLATAAVSNTEAAITKLRQLRPGVRLNRAQLNAVKTYQYGVKLNS